MHVINLWGGPGSGKSTIGLGLTYIMKMNAYSVEYCPEYAKDLVFEERFKDLTNQIKMFSEQNDRLERLKGKVDFVVTDSPLMLPAYYPHRDSLENLKPIILEKFNTYDNINIFLKRKHHYESVGRYQNETEANKVSNELIEFLNENNIKFTEVETSSVNAAVSTLDVVASHLEKVKFTKHLKMPTTKIKLNKV